MGYVFEFVAVTLLVLARLLWLRMRTRIDIVHLHNPPDTLVLSALPLKALGARLVFDQHDLSLELFDVKFEGRAKPARRVLAALESLSYRASALVITTNESYKRLGIERHGVPAERVHVVRNGPRLATLKDYPPSPELVGKAGLVIGYLGHIAKQDSVDHLLLALAALEFDLEYEDWFAVIVGPAEDPDELPALAKELGIGHKVWFTGFRPDPEWRSLLAATDVCVVPDAPNPLNERSTMVKLLEYMALGKPVAAYDLPEHRVSAGDAGIFVTPGDTRALAEGLRSVAHDPEAARLMGMRGQKRIADGLAWEHSARALMGAYDMLLTDSRVPVGAA